MNTIKKKGLIIFLVFVFLAPGWAAYLFYHHPTWLLGTKVNKGELLSTPTYFPLVTQQKKQWKLFLWYPKVCDQNCLAALDKLARIRLALGRHLYEIDILLVLDEKSADIQPAWRERLKEEDIHIAVLAHSKLKALSILSLQPQIFISDPKDYIILAYGKDQNPKDIYSDVKRLLNIKEN